MDPRNGRRQFPRAVCASLIECLMLPACLPPNALIQWSGKRGSLTEKKPGRIPLCVSLSRHYQMLVLPRAHRNMYHKTSVGLLGKERENETIRTRAGK